MASGYIDLCEVLKRREQKSVRTSKFFIEPAAALRYYLTQSPAYEINRVNPTAIICLFKVTEDGGGISLYIHT